MRRAALLGAALALLAGPAAAACAPEAEPNDAPEQVAVVADPGAELCWRGTAQAGNQDMVGWQLSQPGLWRLRLETVPGANARLELVQADAEGGPRTVWRGDLDGATGLVDSPPLLLEPGRWVLAMASPDAVMRWRVYAAPVASPPEPAAPQASDAFASLLRGTGERLEFAWTVTDAGAAGLWTLGLQVPLGQSVSAEVYGPDGTYRFAMAGASADAIAVAADLRLGPGLYRIGVRGLAPGVPALLSAQSPPQAGPELMAEIMAEPDFDREMAHEIAPGQSLRGRLIAATDDTDTDTFAFSVPPDAPERRGQLTVAVDSASTRPISVTLGDDAGYGLADPVTGAGSVRMGPYALPSGRYNLKVNGNLDPADAYVLTLEAAPPLAPGHEAEPNDREEYATPLAVEATLSGRLMPGESDYVALQVTPDALAWWTIILGGPAQADLELKDPTGGTVAGARTLDEGGTRLARMPLAPGRQLLRLRGAGDWTLRAERVPPPGPEDEREPNDDALHATPLADRPLRFWLDHGGDSDQFAVTLAAPQRVTLDVSAPTLAAPEGRLTVPASNDTPRLEFQPDPADPQRMIAQWQGILPPGVLNVALQGSGASDQPGRIAVTLAPPFEPPAAGSVAGSGAANPAAEPAELVFAPDDPRAQSHAARARFGAIASGARVTGWISDPEWRLTGLPETYAGQPLDLRVEAPPALVVGQGADWAVALLDPASGATLGLVQGRAVAKPGTPAQDPQPYQPLPAPLLGALDAARPGFGAMPSQTSAGLFDGQSDGAAQDLPQDTALEIDLAGDEALPVLGLVLTPPRTGSPGQLLRRFRIEAETGGALVPILEASLDPSPRPQAFVLPRPVPATRLRLTALDSWGGTLPAQLSKLAVLVAPGSLPQPMNLAAPDLGGHVLRASVTDYPLIGEASGWPESAVAFRDPSGLPAEWVMQFHRSRAAALSHLEIAADPATAPEHRISALSVQASLAGPMGPWRDLGAFSFDADHARGWLDLPAPVWARALRFVVAAPDAMTATLPGRLSIPEDRAAGGGGSALGEWGEADAVALYENLHPQAPAAPGLAGGPSAETAVPLPPDQLAGGAVAQDRPLWYRLDPPGDALRLRLQNLADMADYALTDHAGNRVELTPQGDVLIAPLAPGAGPYLLRVAKPPDAVMVAWDTSLSVSVFTPAIVAAVQAMATGLAPGVEVMNFAPFRLQKDGEGQPLLRDFATTPGAAWAALQAYPGADSDSDAEAALEVSLQALARQPGRRAVVLITDASFTSSRAAQTWDLIAQVRPRIFALRIPTASHDRAAQVQAAQMQDWASATGGFHRLFASPADAALAFRDLAALLRRPLDYRLIWHAETAPPPPGRIEVRLVPGATSAPVASGRAIELILDASGSMLQRIDGRRKIQIAQSTLAGLVDQAVPPGTPLALRVFGTGGKGSCESRLALPLAPLVPDAARAAIAQIRARDGARTAIAASLALVPADLGRDPAQGRLVILVTDGEETCGGDPQAQIAALRAEGLDVRLNIVGFDLGDGALKAQFAAWAQAGGGDFLDARDESSLRAALAAALLPGYRVTDSDGQQVAAGTVGGAARDLPPGRYLVEIDSQPPRILDPVEIRPGALTAVELPPG